MEFLSSAAPPNFQFQQTPISSRLSPCTLSISSLYRQLPYIGGVSFALKTGSDGGKLRSHESYDLDLVQKPIISPQASTNDDQAKAPDKVRGRDDEEEDVGDQNEEEDRRYRGVRERETTWVDWEDKILEDTVPLVGFVRMILHSGRYACGERLTPEHEKTILERVLAYHPEYEKKIGCGVDYVTIDYHPEFGDSRCLFIVRKDGKMVDFSYWKCMKGLIRKNYPLYADSFILRHFRRRRRNN